jgi:hypothetical protein
VVVPAGDAVLEFRYQPAGLALGLRVFGVAVLILLVWILATIWQHRRTALVQDRRTA